MAWVLVLISFVASVLVAAELSSAKMRFVAPSRQAGVAEKGAKALSSPAMASTFSIKSLAMGRKQS